MAINLTSLIIPATDGFALAAILLEPQGQQPKAVIQFHSGTGIKKEFYLKFARHLAEEGFAVLLFDYRGIGGSRPKSLRGFEAYMRHWGERDMTGVLDWLVERYPDQQKFVVGHSMGGQLVGLMRNYQYLSGVVAIAASVGYWRIFPAPYKYFTAAMWYGYFPISTALFGYAPAKWMRLGEDLPKGVALEWSAWCKNSRYLSAFFGQTIEQHFYHEIRVPFKAYIMADDKIATRLTGAEILAYYANASIEQEIIAPQDVQAASIGHFGFFSSKFSNSLWQRPVEWLHQVL